MKGLTCGEPLHRSDPDGKTYACLSNAMILRVKGATLAQTARAFAYPEEEVTNAEQMDAEELRIEPLWLAAADRSWPAR